jgi:hypothetical protein
MKSRELAIFATNFAVHITTRDSLRVILSAGELRARSRLPPLPNPYARVDLIVARDAVTVSGEPITSVACRK